jgi:HEXXH motif-containing protein
MLLDHVYPRFPAPWRAGMRPAGGFFHGTFVFAGLSQYWAALAHSQPTGVDLQKAKDNAIRFAKQAVFGIQSLRQFALLTKRGEALLDQLADAIGLNKGERMLAPGEAFTL